MDGSIKNKEKNRIRFNIVLCIIGAALMLTLMIFPLYGKINHFYDKGKEIHTISFHMSQENPKGSYGHEMRIVNLFINGNSVDLKQFENEDWVWHGEWGYILYQNGNNDFVIESDEPINTFKMEYVKQEGSGFCRIELGENTINLNMYRRTWKNSLLKVYFQSALQKYISFADIYLLSLFIVFLGYRILVYINKKDEVVGGIGSSLTMFDFAKGMGMILIIFGHSTEDVITVNEITQNVNSAFMGVFGIGLLYSLMTMFFIASGYGFRKGDIKNVARIQLKYLLLPYWKVALGVTVVSLARVFLHATFNHKDLLFKVLPFALFSAHDGAILGVDIGSIGPIWYVVSLCFGWIILSLIFLIESQQIQFFLVGVCAVISFILNRFDVYLFCLAQIFAAVPMIFAGYFIRKNKIWTKETGAKRIAYILLAILFLAGAVYNGTSFAIAGNNFGNNPIVGLLVSILGGFFLLRIILTLNKPLKGKAGLIKKIGRESYLLFYIHAFEYLAIPWKQIMSGIALADWLRIFIIFVCRSILIWMILIAIKKIRIIKKHGE